MKQLTNSEMVRRQRFIKPGVLHKARQFRFEWVVIRSNMEVAMNIVNLERQRGYWLLM